MKNPQNIYVRWSKVVIMHSRNGTSCMSWPAVGSMPSRGRNLAECSSWETDGSGDYWRSPSTTPHILFDDFLERFTQMVLLIGGSSLSRQTHITLKKNKKHSSARAGHSSLAQLDCQSYFKCWTPGDSIGCRRPSYLYFSDDADPMSRDEYKLCHGAMYSFKTGYILQTVQQMYPRRAS
jgi:hypothetical protein